MSFLSTLLKGLGIAGGAVATGLTGGAASPALIAAIGAGSGAASAAGGALGAAEAGRAAGRAAQANNNNTRDQIAQRAQESEQNALLSASAQKEKAASDAAQLDLAQKNYELNTPATEERQAILGNLASNIQDVVAQGPPGVPITHYTGGIRPSDLGPEARQGGTVLAQNALKGMLNPATMAPLPTADPTVLPQFQLTPQPQPGFLDKVMGAAGTAGAFGTATNQAMAAIQKILGTQPKVPYVAPPNSGLPNGVGTAVNPLQIPGLLNPTDDGQ